MTPQPVSIADYLQHCPPERWRAVAAQARLELPDARDEDWRLTDIRRLRQHFYPPTDADIATSGVIDDLVEQARIPGAMTLVLCNGRLVKTLSDRRLDGLVHSAASGQDTPDSAPPDGLSALAEALAVEAVQVRLDPGQSLAAPLHILHISHAPGHSLHSKIRLDLAAGSAATLITSFVGLRDALINHHLTIELGAHANLQHFHLQNDAPEALHFLHQTTRLAEQARYCATVLSLGAALSRHASRIYLSGPKARAEISGLTLARDRQQAGLAIAITHGAEKTSSRQRVKAIADARGHAVFQGKITVTPAGQGTDAHQLSKALLLSPRARVDNKPELEIHADDVKCSHGSAVGALDPKALFYLMARGIDPSQARILLTEAFAIEILDQIADPDLKALGHRYIRNWLGGDHG